MMKSKFMEVLQEDRPMRKIEDFILQADEEELAHIEKFIKLRREQLDSASDFVRKVLSKLPPLQDERDRVTVESGIRKQFSKGWSVNDSVAFHRVMQEFDPDYPEDDALKIMKRISDKYRTSGM